jgi:anaerobic selenocysteine-containing dehydrogenase
MAQQYWTGYNGDATYAQDMAAQKDKLWQANGMAWLQAHGVANPPTWTQVLKADKGKGLTSFLPSEFWTTGPSSTTFNGYDINGKLYPIDTQSGKYEHYWDVLADNWNNGKATTTSTRNQQHFDFKGRQYAHVPNDWKDLQPISVYHPCFNGMEDYPKLTANGLPRLQTYPLMILTTNTRVRIHYLMGDPGNPRTRDTIRHSLIINVADAKARGIKDNDIVRVFNDQGQVAVPAYVTSRIMPGVVIIRTGMGPNYSVNTAPFGTPWNGQRLDMNLGPQTIMGGAVNQFTGGDDISPVTPAKVTSSVQVELYAPAEAF